MRIRAETTLREPFPECAVVLTTGKDLVCLDNGVTSLEERGSARLQLHAADHELNDECVSMLGNKRFGCTVDLVFAGSIEVAGRDGAILLGQGGEEGIRETVLLDELIGDNPKDLGPDFTDGVHAPVTWLIESLVCGGVDVDTLKMHVRRYVQPKEKMQLTVEYM